MSPPLLVLIGVAITAVLGLVGVWLKNSGLIGTSAPQDLWAATEALRKDLAAQLVRSDELLARSDEKNEALSKRLEDSMALNAQQAAQLVANTTLVADLRDQLTDCAKLVKQLRDELDLRAPRQQERRHE